MNKVIYYNKNTNQVSLNKRDGIEVSGHGEYDDPYFNLSANKDGCSIRTSKSGEGLICFAKEQGNNILDANSESSYYQAFVKVDEIVDPNCLEFDCYRVIKNSDTGKGEKAPYNYEPGDFIF